MGMNPCGHAGTQPLLQSSAVAALKLLNFWTRGLDFLFVLGPTSDIASSAWFCQEQPLLLSCVSLPMPQFLHL